MNEKPIDDGPDEVRDDLVAACRLALTRFYTDGWPLNQDNVAACKALSDAIAKATGERP